MTSNVTTFITLLAPLLLSIKEKHSIVCLPSECQVWVFSRRYELIVIYRLCLGNCAMKKAKVKCTIWSVRKDKRPRLTHFVRPHPYLE